MFWSAGQACDGWRCDALVGKSGLRRVATGCFGRQSRPAMSGDAKLWSASQTCDEWRRDALVGKSGLRRVAT